MKDKKENPENGITVRMTGKPFHAALMMRSNRERKTGTKVDIKSIVDECVLHVYEEEAEGNE